MLDDKRLAEIRERAERAQGLWGTIDNVVAFANRVREEIPDLLAENARLRAELEAAKRDLHLFAQCVTCEHTYDGGMRCRVPIKAREHKGDYCSTWQWRGVCPANTPDAREGGGEG